MINRFPTSFTHIRPINYQQMPLLKRKKNTIQNSRSNYYNHALMRAWYIGREIDLNIQICVDRNGRV